MPWHITPAENVSSILASGLEPRIGERSMMVSESEPRVYLFNTYDDLLDGVDIIDAFEEDQELALFHVAVPRTEGAWLELSESVPADRVQLVVRDLDATLDPRHIEAIRGLDRVDDPYASLEAFRESQAIIPASVFGELVGDMKWEEDARDLHVYACSWYIELLDDGRCLLDLGSESYVTGPEVSLSDLEERLFDYVLSEVRPTNSTSLEP